jgi:hypothetical protein
VSLGIVATPPGGKPHEFCVSLKRVGDQWVIATWVWRDLWPEGEGYEVLRSFPDRHAATLDECIAQLQGAVADLATCDDALDQPQAR